MRAGRARRLTVAFVVALAAMACGARGDPLYCHWPQFPRPARLVEVSGTWPIEAGMLFESAAGLCARGLLEGRTDRLLYERFGNSGYEAFLGRMVERTGARSEGPVELWEAVEGLRDVGLVEGYLLYRLDETDRPLHHSGPRDESVNVATSLAPLLHGVLVSEGLEAEAKARGLPLLFDARERTDDWCLAEYADRFSRRLVCTADPKTRNIRSLAIAAGAFVVSGPGEAYERALARCEPDVPVLGWGCGAEDAHTLPSSELGAFQTATNWCHNLPLFMTEDAEASPAAPAHCRRGLGDLRWRSGVHYVAFVMSDGDNVQWLMGNFLGGSEGASYYESPRRGEFPLGWTFPYVELAQLCPYALEELFGRATPNDGFVLFGGGYYYPDRYGARRAEPCLELHAARTASYMRHAGLRTIAFNLQDWDGEEAVAAYRAFARAMPELNGILTVQYYPYSGGEGRILWTPDGAGGELPVVSCRLCIWAQTGRPRDTTPAGVAAQLNALTPGSTWSADNFSFVMAHAWSRFRDTKGEPSLTAEEEGVDQGADAPGTARGVESISWCVDRLDPDVRVVTPGELVLLVRLHLRTRQTLTRYHAELTAVAERRPHAQARRLLRRAEEMLPAVRDGDHSGRRCFELLRRVDGVLGGSR